MSVPSRNPMVCQIPSPVSRHVARQSKYVTICGALYDAKAERAGCNGTRLTVTVKAPATYHEIQWGKTETWIQSAGKPNEQALKTRLRELLRA